MPLNIKNAEVERLADQVARLAGETKNDPRIRAGGCVMLFVGDDFRHTDIHAAL